jgi:hypothetical protein
MDKRWHLKGAAADLPGLIERAGFSDPDGLYAAQHDREGFAENGPCWTTSRLRASQFPQTLKGKTDVDNR